MTWFFYIGLLLANGFTMKEYIQKIQNGEGVGQFYEAGENVVQNHFWPLTFPILSDHPWLKLSVETSMMFAMSWLQTFAFYVFVVLVSGVRTGLLHSIEYDAVMNYYADVFNDGWKVLKRPSNFITNGFKGFCECCTRERNKKTLANKLRERIIDVYKRYMIGEENENNTMYLPHDLVPLIYLLNDKQIKAIWNVINKNMKDGRIELLKEIFRRILEKYHEIKRENLLQLYYQENIDKDKIDEGKIEQLCGKSNVLWIKHEIRGN